MNMDLVMGIGMPILLLGFVFYLGMRSDHGGEPTRTRH